ncbi:MAG: 6-carboxytetrahydropterin synthase QueD [Acidobacteriota bacterium]
MVLSKRFRFEAAHRLPHHEGMCAHLHGHSYLLRVSIRVKVDPATGMGCDFAELDEVVRERVLVLADHRDLNQLLDNPTAENICRWVWERLSSSVPGELVEIELFETEDSSCLYRGPAGEGV